MESVGRQGPRRLFDPAVLDRLALIALGQSAGFSLDEPASVLTGGLDDRKRLLTKAEELDRTITQ
ncbi:MerR family DNA-binding protein [Acanthopleuribacter pedis]|uniref:MerR family DNA-binding protein n=1 Tax=Acanthopleuribacter pedis TaxID=442870 RepID=A0A8J7U1Y7_9BACT|nr:MerR family DNA-binding protein [Acanthopleuribacter pedis]